jgi:hypothetical protein
VRLLINKQMRRIVSAINSLLIIQVVLIVFHLLIIFKIIPASFVWGGRILSEKGMFILELASLLISLFFLLALWYKKRTIQQGQRNRVVDVFIWIFFFYFLLNTLGNLLAKSTIEKAFALLTLAVAAIIWIVMKTKEETGEKPG